MFERAVRVAVATLIAAASSAQAAQDADVPVAGRDRPAVDAQPRHVAHHPKPARPALDRSGGRRIGKASIYARKFNGRTMADGTPMDPREDVAASKTLPLGTRARVTNLETGDSAVVTIRDRGPHVKGRIVDLSPAAAAKVGIDRHEGVSKVAVTPLSLPPPVDGKESRAGGPAPSGTTSSGR